MEEYNVVSPNRNLIKMTSCDNVYLDMANIVFLRYIPFSDEIEIGWTGGAQVKLPYGKKLLHEIQGYMFNSDSEEIYNG